MSTAPRAPGAPVETPDLSPRAVRARRGAREGVDPWAPPPVAVDLERQPDGRLASAAAVFLVGAECPFTCVFCDLWKGTLDAPTPAGALPAQLEAAVATLEADHGLEPAETVLKLYNASNFFEPRAVPPEDLPTLAALARPFARVVVECHPRLVDRRCVDFAARLDGRLEVALGLETVHPEALARLGKGATLEDFDRAAGFLADHDLDLRAFVLVGAPFVPAAEAVDWAVRSVEHAAAAGAVHGALIPVRGGGATMDQLEAAGGWSRPTLEQLEEALERSRLAVAGAALGSPTIDSPTTVSSGAVSSGAVSSMTIVTADLWDLERLDPCAACLPRRRRRLEALNRALPGEGIAAPRSPEPCPECGAGAQRP